MTPIFLDSSFIFKRVKGAPLARCLLLSLVLLFSFIVPAEDLHVFVPTEVRATEIQKQLESACPKLKVVVYGRSNDFVRELKKDTITTILTVSDIVEHYSGYSVMLQGVRGGKPDEPYQLITIQDKIDVTQLSNKRVGVVDLLGRKPMQELVVRYLKSDVKVKRVTKLEDLLPLLMFENVEAILVSDHLLQSIKQKSELVLVENSIGLTLKLSQLASKDPSKSAQAKACIASFTKPINDIFGVESWNTP